MLVKKARAVKSVGPGQFTSRVILRPDTAVRRNRQDRHPDALSKLVRCPEWYHDRLADSGASSVSEIAFENRYSIITSHRRTEDDGHQ
jgi:hypothetical protein